MLKFIMTREEPVTQKKYYDIQFEEKKEYTLMEFLWEILARSEEGEIALTYSHPIKQYENDKGEYRHFSYKLGEIKDIEWDHPYMKWLVREAKCIQYSDATNYILSLDIEGNDDFVKAGDGQTSVVEEQLKKLYENHEKGSNWLSDPWPAIMIGLILGLHGNGFDKKHYCPYCGKKLED